MHSIEQSRKRFFDIFFMKRQEKAGGDRGLPLYPAGCGPAAVEIYS
ncbi:MAG TPA: hypothetical protein VH252_04785 [Chthoniobacterales bacterium]|jgi:hypothetical protein|nr:hypothetical protein [Chthoniobacterales bacterium]